MRSSKAEKSSAVSRPERPSANWPSYTTAKEQPLSKVRLQIQKYSFFFVTYEWTH
jgi:hypothetical protein